MNTFGVHGSAGRLGGPLALALGATLVGVLSPGSASAAPAIYTSGHADVGVGYHVHEGVGELEPHWHTHIGAVVNGTPEPVDGEYEPGDMLALTTATRLTPSGGGGLSALLGVPDGTQVWAMGSTTYQPNLGWGAEELAEADWVGKITVRFNPEASTLPLNAAFGLYTTNLAGTNVVDRIFSSVSAAATDFDNTLELTPGDHAHFQWAFTQPGLYDLNFTWSGTHVTDGFKTATATFGVQAVPEPSTLAMLAMAGGMGAFTAVRRLRRLRRSAAARQA